MLSTSVSERGDVFLWGLNQDGQCGLSPGDTRGGQSGGCGFVVTPHLLEGVPPVDRVSCGWSHTIAICGRPGDLFCSFHTLL